MDLGFKGYGLGFGCRVSLFIIRSGSLSVKLPDERCGM